MPMVNCLAQRLFVLLGCKSCFELLTWSTQKLSYLDHAGQYKEILIPHNEESYSMLPFLVGHGVLFLGALIWLDPGSVPQITTGNQRKTMLMLCSREQRRPLRHGISWKITKMLQKQTPDYWHIAQSFADVIFLDVYGASLYNEHYTVELLGTSRY